MQKKETATPAEKAHMKRAEAVAAKFRERRENQERAALDEETNREETEEESIRAEKIRRLKVDQQKRK